MSLVYLTSPISLSCSHVEHACLPHTHIHTHFFDTALSQVLTSSMFPSKMCLHAMAGCCNTVNNCCLHCQGYQVMINKCAAHAATLLCQLQQVCGITCSDISTNIPRQNALQSTVAMLREHVQPHGFCDGRIGSVILNCKRLNSPSCEAQACSNTEPSGYMYECWVTFPRPNFSVQGCTRYREGTTVQSFTTLHQCSPSNFGEQSMHILEHQHTCGVSWT